jgi:hypothetical protein
MAKTSYDNISRPVRKRSAVTGMLVGVRLQVGQIEAIDAWAAKQDPPVTRPEAIRGMIDAMLHILAKDPGEKLRRSEKAAVAAKDLAAAQIDRLGDRSAPLKEQASRKRRLLKGPEEFREVRVDRPKAKGK